MSTASIDGLSRASAAVLRAERAVVGMTIEELSERSGIPKVSVQRFLAGRRPINLDVLACLCIGLRLSPRDVVGRAEELLHRGDPELVHRVVAGVGRVTTDSVDGVTSATESS